MIRWQAKIAAGRQERIAERVPTLPHRCDVNRPIAAMPGGCAAGMGLKLAEIWLHIIEAPSGIAGIPPIVEIRGSAADEDHRIDGPRAPQHFAACRINAPTAEIGLEFGVVHPVDTQVVVTLGVAHRNFQPERFVAGAGLYQQHAMSAALRQPGRDNRARRACADDHEIEFRHEAQPRAGAKSFVSAGSAAICRCSRSPS
jgi:hypothetical protein